MNMRRMFFALIIPVMLIAACTATTSDSQSQISPLAVVSPLASPVAAPSSVVSPLASPVAAPSSVISPLASPVAAPSSVVVFQLDRPILAGATKVRGTGPAGVPVYIADVTFMGDPLGTGTIGADGKFTITVSPLPDGHRIGVALGILKGTRWKPEDFYTKDYYGPGAMQFPQVGFFHDTIMVGQP